MEVISTSDTKESKNNVSSRDTEESNDNVSFSVTIYQILNCLFFLAIISEIIVLIVMKIVHLSGTPFSLWFTLPFVLLTGLTASYYKTIMHAISFLLVNLTPIIIILCNQFEYDYYDFLDYNDTKDNIITSLDNDPNLRHLVDGNEILNGFNVDNDVLRNRELIGNYLTGDNLTNIMKAVNEDISPEYIKPYQKVMGILITYQSIFTLLCVILFVTSLYIRKCKGGNLIRSWKWIQIKDLKKFKEKMMIYRLEETFFLIAISYLGIWVLMTEVYDIFKLDNSWFFENHDPSIMETLFNQSSNTQSLDALYNIIGIVTIIPISTVLITIRRSSMLLYIVFYIASLLEIGIIITRLYIFYAFYEFYSYLRNENYFTHELASFSVILSKDILFRERFILGIFTVLFLIILIINTTFCQKCICHDFLHEDYEHNNESFYHGFVKIKKKSERGVKSIERFLGRQ